MLEKLNPFYKSIGIVLVGILISFSYSIPLHTILFSLSIVCLLASNVPIKKIAKTMFPVLVAAAGLFTTGYLFSKDSGEQIVTSLQQSIVIPASAVSGLQLAIRILAFAALGMLFAYTTNMQEFVYSLEQQGKLPARFAYGILAAFHLAPIIPYEYKKTRRAFQARGIKPFPVSPKLLTPFLVKAVRWSESLAIAMESKAFDVDAPRTSYRILSVSMQDYIFAFGIPAFILIAMFFIKDRL